MYQTGVTSGKAFRRIIGAQGVCYNADMHLVITDSIARLAERQLSRNDPVLAPVIARAGTCPIRPHTDYYRELVEAIIGQQLSVKAAAAILLRFRTFFGEDFPIPAQIMETSVDELRALGLSRAKSLYVLDLARHVASGRLDFGRFDTMDNDEIMRELTAVKGIGEWTAHMFLLFCMARTDILPTGDLGVRSSIQKLYGLETLPDKSQMETLAEANGWAPHLSIASWYLWQHLDNAPSASAAA